MTNAAYDLDAYQDIEIRNMIAERRARGYSDASIIESIHAKGRDNARTPMQWNDHKNAGFTSGTPWLKVNPNYKSINVAAAENDENSILNYYRYLIAMRKRESVFLDGTYTPIEFPREDLFAYTRENDTQKLTVVANFTEHPIPFDQTILDDAGEPQISNYETWPSGGILRPYEAAMYLMRK